MRPKFANEKSNIFRTSLRWIFMFITVFITHHTFAQQSVSIGTTQVNANAVLWLQGNGAQALIIPIGNKSNINAPVKGMVIYNDSDNKIYYFDNAWVDIGGASAAPQNLTKTGNVLSLTGSVTPVNIANIAPTTGGQILQWDAPSNNWTSSAPTLPTNGQVLKWNGTAWAPAADNAGAGSVTSVTASAPLSVTNGTSTPAISMTAASTSTNGFLTSSDWNTFNSKMGISTAAGGDISGTLPAASVTKIRGVNITSTTPLLNQVLQFDGTNWTPTALPASNVDKTIQTGALVGNGTTITGRTAASGGQIFRRNVANTDFEFASLTAADISGIANNAVPRGNGTGLVAGSITDDGTVVGIGALNVGNKFSVSTSAHSIGIYSTNSRTSSASNVGVRGDAAGSTSSNYGLYGSASGVSLENYGVYGVASNASTNWAGYFAGNTAVTGGLAVGATENFGTSGQVLTSQGAGTPPVWKTGTKSAFRAFIGGGTFGLTTSSQKLPFSLLDFDISGNFSTTNNEFVAPVKGVYSFSWKIYYQNTGNAGNYTYLNLMKNGGGILSEAYYNVGTIFPRVTGTTTLNLLAGDKISLSSYNAAGGGTVEGSNSYTEFSGFLVFEN
jgi:hypothetical protein